MLVLVIVCLILSSFVLNHFFCFSFQQSVSSKYSQMALNEEKKGKKKDDEDHISIKCFLRSIIREGYEDEVIDWIRSKAMEATKITVLASLLFLNKVNSAHCEKID